MIPRIKIRTAFAFRMYQKWVETEDEYWLGLTVTELFPYLQMIVAPFRADTDVKDDIVQELVLRLYKDLRRCISFPKQTALFRYIYRAYRMEAMTLIGIARKPVEWDFDWACMKVPGYTSLGNPEQVLLDIFLEELKTVIPDHVQGLATRFTEKERRVCWMVTRMYMEGRDVDEKFVMARGIKASDKARLLIDISQVYARMVLRELVAEEPMADFYTKQISA